METDETVYGTHEDSHVMSERVQSLAASIYKEFERMIKKYDEDVVKELMPLVVGILESMDQAYEEKRENEVELELLRDDNEQLLTQYEREKQLRKTAEQKYLEVEDAKEEERKDLEGKVESLESIVRMFELKAKNAQDHISRLDDKEAEMKREYTKLHERYTELFKTHMDYMERTKLLMGGDRIMEMGSTPKGGKMGGYQLPNLKPINMAYSGAETPTKPGQSPPTMASPRGGPDAGSLRAEMRDVEGMAISKEMKDSVNKSLDTADKSQSTDIIEVRERNVGTNQGADTADSTASPMDSEPSPAQDLAKSPAKDSATSPAQDLATSPAKDSSTSPAVSPARTADPPATTESSPAPTDSTERSAGDAKSDAKASGALTEQEKEGSDTFDKLHYVGDPMPPSSGDMMVSTEDFEESFGHSKTSPMTIAGTSLKGKQNESSIYDELAFHDSEALGEMDDGVDITGKVVNPGEYASSELEEEDVESLLDPENDNVSTGMGKEVENLILENTELLATKNALNVVKDDLIAKVDELTRADSDQYDEYIPMVLRSEQEILREEIVSLQTVKTKLKQRVSELEDELKKMREELEKAKSAKSGEEGGDEEDIPMAQRKRFTRVEMARVLMERNQYKERLMELQEAVRWTEMIRASREHPELAQQNIKKKSSIWGIFSNLFSSPNKPTKRPVPGASIKYSAPTTRVTPTGDPNKKQRDKYNLGEKAKAYDFLQDDMVTEKKRQERERERREQYKQVQVHVRKDDGRMQAYGWSLPAKVQAPSTNKDAQSNRSSVPVPVPVYCRPLMEKDPSMKIWCAAGVNLSGGRTKDGGSLVGASIFYSQPKTDDSKSEDDIEKLNQELKEHEKSVKHNPESLKLSSLVWICTTAHNSSRVTVVDANNPADVLETFHVTSSHILCIASVPGALESDFPADEETLKQDIEIHEVSPPASAPGGPTEEKDPNEVTSIGNITFVQCATGTTSKSGSFTATPTETPPDNPELSARSQTDLSSVSEALNEAVDSKEGDNKTSESSSPPSEEEVKSKVIKATGRPASEGSSPVPQPMEGIATRRLRAASDLVKDGLNTLPSDNDFVYVELEKQSSMMPTMWLGTQSGSLYVHSSVAQWKRCLHSVKLKDSILSITHVRGRVLVALADGTVAVFHRSADNRWDLTNYHLVDLGKPHHSIRCMTVIANKHVWCGYRNKVHVLDPKTLKVEKSFDAHPRKESQVRQLAWVGDGVWVSIRLDSTLRLYHAYTHQHLQDVDIEPYVSKMLGTGKLGFSFVRITSLLVSCSRLWIGTGNGVIISVPLSEKPPQSLGELQKGAITQANKHSVTTQTAGRPGSVIRVYSDAKTDAVTPGSFLPYCSMSQAQLSFHGHKDAVKFFVAVPGAPQRGLSGTATPSTSKESSKKSSSAPSKNMLVLSGGEGYIDFRMGDTDEEENSSGDEKKSLSKGDRSHLIIWHLANVV